MPTIYKFLDLSDKRNIYAVGDIHGCFDKLREKLQEVGFDGTKDALISVGDLVDRGPQSHQAIDFCRQPWFHRVIGNHEEMTAQNVLGTCEMHTINGGGWMAPLNQEEREFHIDVLMDASYLLEIATPNGQRIGFVHADLAWNNWQENIEYPNPKVFTWSRMGINNLRDPNYDPTVTGIDKVFFGHNALQKPYSRGNCNWIDTGCGFEDGKLTIVNVETYGNILTK